VKKPEVLRTKAILIPERDADNTGGEITLRPANAGTYPTKTARLNRHAKQPWWTFRREKTIMTSETPRKNNQGSRPESLQEEELPETCVKYSRFDSDSDFTSYPQR
jgi:hypothetical protein